MMHITTLSLVALGMMTALPAHADSQPIPARFRGMMVCERMPDTAGTDILHVPLDMVVRGNSVQFARPTFNPDGTRVTGSELGSGTLDADGKVHLTSEWVSAASISRAITTERCRPPAGRSPARRRGMGQMA